MSLSTSSTVAIAPTRVAFKFFSSEKHPQTPLIVRRLSNEKRVPVRPLKLLLAKLEEEGVPEEDVPARLEAAAEELVKLRAGNDSCKKGPPRITAIAAKAQALIDKGDFDAARAAFARGQDAVRKLRDELSRQEAQLLVQEARIEHLRMAYRSAASKYAQAAYLVCSFDTEGSKEWLFAQAGEFLDQGNAFGDTDGARAGRQSLS